jgi:hypothetical protein
MVEIEFVPQGDTTGIRLQHSGVPGPGIPSTESHWSEFLGVLDELLNEGVIN